jgi:hypothetical protein
MGRVSKFEGGNHGHKLSEYIKLNDKPKSKRTRKFKQNTFNAGFLGRTDLPTRYDRENLATGSY